MSDAARKEDWTLAEAAGSLAVGIDTDVTRSHDWMVGRISVD